MERAELNTFKQTLLDVLRSIERPSQRLDELAVENTPDTIDGVQRATDRELTIRQIESDFNRLQSVKLALQRINDLSYGTCIHCDGEIGIKRLNAVPWASYCIACQEVVDCESSGERILAAF